MQDGRDPPPPMNESRSISRVEGRTSGARMSSITVIGVRLVDSISSRASLYEITGPHFHWTAEGRTPSTGSARQPADAIRLPIWRFVFPHPEQHANQLMPTHPRHRTRAHSWQGMGSS